METCIGTKVDQWSEILKMKDWNVDSLYTPLTGEKKGVRGDGGNGIGMKKSKSFF